MKSPAQQNDYSAVTVIIPALNEANSIPLVLSDLPVVGRVIVVDNGSTDDTASLAAKHGASVIHEPRRGYGSACLAGIEEMVRRAEESQLDPQVVVFLDADYSDHPDELPQLVDPILDGRLDFVLGSRLLGRRDWGAMPPQSVYGNRLACCLIGQRHFRVVFCRKSRHGTGYCEWRCRQVTHDLILLTSIPDALSLLVFVFV